MPATELWSCEKKEEIWHSAQQERMHDEPGVWSGECGVWRQAQIATELLYCDHKMHVERSSSGEKRGELLQLQQ
ncbi:hypothetical protein ACLKA6_010705 [Drosophila palustris]